MINVGATMALEIHSRGIMGRGFSNRWNNFSLQKRNQARSHLPFETHNLTNSDDTTDMETSSVVTNATIVCSAMSNRCSNARIRRRQKLHISKQILLLDFLEKLDSDWETTTQYEYQHYIDESSGNFQHSMNVSEEIDDNLLSAFAMVPTDDEDKWVLQATKYADLLYTRYSRTLEYLETIKTDEWEIATLSDLNSDESSCQLESKTDHDMFNSENGSCLSGQKAIGKIAKRPKNTGFARSLDEDFQSVSVEDDYLIIPSSSIGSENDEVIEPPIRFHIKQIEDCSVQVVCGNFNEEKTVTDQNFATGTEAVSPDDPLGFQHLTWQESNSSSDASVLDAISQWDDVDNNSTVNEFALQPITDGIRDYRPPIRKLTQQRAPSPVPTMPQALKKHGCFAANTGATSEVHTQGSERLAQMANASQKARPGKPSPAITKEKCTRKRKVSATTLPTSPKRVQFDLTPQVRYKAKLRGANALLRHTIQRQSKTKVLAPKKSKKAKKKETTIVLNSSSDSIESNINTILQNVRSSFDEVNYRNENKIAKKDIASQMIEISEESLTQIVKTSVRDVMRSILKSRRRRAFRRSAPIRKIVLKKMFVPKRKLTEDKVVQVSFDKEVQGDCTARKNTESPSATKRLLRPQTRRKT